MELGDRIPVRTCCRSAVGTPKSNLGATGWHMLHACGRIYNGRQSLQRSTSALATLRQQLHLPRQHCQHHQILYSTSGHITPPPKHEDPTKGSLASYASTIYTAQAKKHCSGPVGDACERSEAQHPPAPSFVGAWNANVKGLTVNCGLFRRGLTAAKG